MEVVNNNCCRTCAKCLNVEERVSIGSKISANKSILDLIKEWTAIKVVKDNKLPQFICKICLTFVKSLIDFITLIQKSDRDFKALLYKNEELANRDELNKSFKESYRNYKDKFEDPISEETELVENKSETKRDSEPFKCTTCHKTFKKSHHYKSHMTTHTGERRYSCKTCGKGFARSYILMYHMRVHTGEKKFKCNFCSKAFTHPSNLYKHKKIHTNTRNYTCEFCSKSFIQSEALKIHIRRVHTGERPFLCEMCSKSFSCQSGLWLHKQDTHLQKETCPLCNKQFSHRILKQHIEGHRNKEHHIKKCICEQCGKNFSSAHNLRQHLLTHSGIKPYASQMSEKDSLPKYLCSKCYQQLLAVNEFRELIISSDMHLKRKLTSPIQYCGETSVSLNTGIGTDLIEALKDDPENTSEIKDEIQDSCKNNKASCESDVGGRMMDVDKLELDNLIVDPQDGFMEETHLKRESIDRVKAGRKPSKISINKRKVHEFKCEICKKVLFGRSNRLEQHIIMAHSDIKNYACETCNKKFKSKQQLVNHTRVHTGEKPYLCEVCKECFASPQNLFNHKKKHTGKYKSYKCDSCDKCYSTPGELETHKRVVHTGEKPFLCEICSRAYSSIRNLGLHIKSVHEKTEKCPKCDLMLSNKRIKQHLQKHQDKEDDFRRYTCDKCGKGFFTSHALKKHQVVHTGERRYSCQVCNKSFSQKSAVDTHMKTHSDARGFCCELCAKTFKYKQHLQSHLSKNHKDNKSYIT